MTLYSKQKIREAEIQARLNPLIANPIIEKKVFEQVKKEKSIVYGARSLNKNTVGFLNHPTVDYDILSKTPKKSARTLERTLDKTFGGDYFGTKPAIHKGTYKVFRKKIGENRGATIADFTKPQKNTRVVSVGGIQYTSLDQEEINRKRILKNKNLSFKHERARDDLRRIRLQKNWFGGGH
jgi:hypothetical protein